jgi:hypothetical protein
MSHKRKRHDVRAFSADTSESARSQANDPHREPRDAPDIALRAYELYQQRGGEDGRDLDDWLRAEAELHRR